MLNRLNEVSRLPDRYPESMERDMPERRDQAVVGGIQPLSSDMRAAGPAK